MRVWFCAKFCIGSILWIYHYSDNIVDLYFAIYCLAVKTYKRLKQALQRRWIGVSSLNNLLRTWFRVPRYLYIPNLLTHDPNLTTNLLCKFSYNITPSVQTYIPTLLPTYTMLIKQPYITWFNHENLTLENHKIFKKVLCTFVLNDTQLIIVHK